VDERLIRMRRISTELRCRVWAVSARGLIALAAVGCSSTLDAPNVSYGTQQQIGRWAAESTTGVAGLQFVGSAGSSVGTVSQPGSAGNGSVLPPPIAGVGAAGIQALQAGQAGANAPTAGTGVGSAGRAGSTGASGNAAAGAGGSAAVGGSVTSVLFDVTTLAQGGFYQPRNIGAIWVQDSSGKFVKSLEVWAGIRSRYLSKYSAARGGMPVDVTASATLNSHRAHHAMWNLKDRSGQAAPPGKYTLVIEVTDTDFTGKFDTIDFDTSQGPQQVTPPNATYYTMLKVTLQ
jgi:hypothetical protein